MFSTSQMPDANNFRQPTNIFQFDKIVYPRPGLSKIHMTWSSAPCQTTCWNDGNLTVKAMRSPEIECSVVQHPWMENDCYLADIILPVCTKHEIYDIANDLSSGGYQSIYLTEPCCEPLGESMTDFEVCAEVAKRLGPEYYDAYTGTTEGNRFTDEQKTRLFYKATGCEERMSWEEFKDRKIFVVPCRTDLDKVPAGFENFYKDPKNNPLTTPTGLLEFSSSDIEKYMPDDEERLPVPHWVENTDYQNERLSSDRAKKYPLLCMSNHGRWRMHAQCDDITWNREVETMKIRAGDGYQYEPVWLHPDEAKKRGIRHGDIVKVFNERGVVLGAAYVTERLIQRTCYMDHGARFDPIIPGEVDRGGAINLITPTAMIGKNSTGMATSGFLVEVAKVSDEEMQGWKRDYPEAFARKLDYAAGVCLDGWLLES